MLAIRQAQERLQRLEQAIAAAVPDWSLAPLVTALMAMRGMDLISATTLLAEIGDLSRFQTPTELMAYLGLVPSKIRPATPSSADRSPKPATGAPGACWWSARGAISIRRGRTSQATEGRCGAACGSRDCLEGAMPTVPALSHADQERQAQDRRHRRDEDWRFARRAVRTSDSGPWRYFSGECGAGSMIVACCSSTKGALALRNSCQPASFMALPRTVARVLRSG